jgi:hypothetical protein
MRKSNMVRVLTAILLIILSSIPAVGDSSKSDSRRETETALESAPVVAENPTYHDCARFIAGMSNRQSSLRLYEDTPTWISYARFIDQIWERFDQQHLAPMRKWAAQELGAAKTTAVFYPFSGPDFVNLYTLFPHSKTYLMIALEPVGEVPDFATIDNDRFFAGMTRSLYDLLQLNFFITDKLNHSLSKAELKGILPILLFFLAREKAQVLDVRYWIMKPDGTIEESLPTCPRVSGDRELAGVRLEFAGAEDRQTLYYFQVNLRNNFLSRQDKFISFLKGFGPFTTFAKAASYLMHRPGFSDIRQLILEQSRFVLESDSAIPLRYFERTAWNLKFYGTYTSPIARFKRFRQQDLAEIYQQGDEVYPLPFGIDYRHRINTSNLLFAAKKVDLATGAAP